MPYDESGRYIPEHGRGVVVAPGWYDDPDNPGERRWWDGRMWWPSRTSWPDEISMRCPSCKALSSLAPAECELACENRQADYVFRKCLTCDGGVQVLKRRGGTWTCPWCSAQNLVRAPDAAIASAAHIFGELEKRQLLDEDPDRKVLGGFTAVGGSGYTITPGLICSITALVDGVVARAETGEGVAVLPYADLTIAEMAGGATTSGGGFLVADLV